MLRTRAWFGVQLDDDHVVLASREGQASVVMSTLISGVQRETRKKVRQHEGVEVVYTEYS